MPTPTFDARIPDGPLDGKWQRHRAEMRLVSPTNKRRYRVLVIGSGLAGARRIAVPGCFATATMLALWPLVPVLGPDSHPVCWAATGSSGSGANARATTHHPFRAHNFYGYSLSGHRHEAELDELARLVAASA